MHPCRFFTGGDGDCELCPAGTYNENLDTSNGCTDCPVGHYSVIGASSLDEGCVACDGNMVASQAGSPQCQRCQSNAIAGNANTDCYCEVGFYSADWTLGAQTGENKTCAACPLHGADCMHDRIVAKVCTRSAAASCASVPYVLIG